MGRPLRAPRARRNLRPDQAPQDHARVRQHAQPGRDHLPGAVAHQRRRPRHRAPSRLARRGAAPQGRRRDGGGAPAGGGVHVFPRSRRRLGRRRSRRQRRRAQGRLAAPAAHRPRQPPHGRALEGRAGAGQSLRGARMPRRARRHRGVRAGHAARPHRRARRAGTAHPRLGLRRGFPGRRALRRGEKRRALCRASPAPTSTPRSISSPPAATRSRPTSASPRSARARICAGASPIP